MTDTIFGIEIPELLLRVVLFVAPPLLIILGMYLERYRQRKRFSRLQNKSLSLLVESLNEPREHIVLLHALRQYYETSEFIEDFIALDSKKIKSSGLTLTDFLQDGNIPLLIQHLDSIEENEMVIETMIAGVSAVSATIQAWVAFRDRKRASEAFEAEFERVIHSDTVSVEAEVLKNIVPEDVLDIIEERVRRCWAGYKDVITGDGEFLPGEIDDATAAVKKCICRELSRLYDLNAGQIPPGDLGDWWNEYCVAR